MIFLILAYTTGRHFNNFSISEITFISALFYLSINSPYSKIVYGKSETMRPEAESGQQVSRILMAMNSAFLADTS